MKQDAASTDDDGSVKEAERLKEAAADSKVAKFEEETDRLKKAAEAHEEDSTQNKPNSNPIQKRAAIDKGSGLPDSLKQKLGYTSDEAGSISESESNSDAKTQKQAGSKDAAKELLMSNGRG